MGKLLLLVVVVGLIVGFFAFGWQEYASLEYLKEKRSEFALYYAENQLITALIYLSVYILVTALSLPGAAVLTLMGGAIFGLTKGIFLASIASTVGATLAFLAARYLFRDAVQARFGEKLAVVNRKFSEEGAFYLFTMRLIPAVPFFVINLLMALTSIRVISFFFVSQLGMLPGTLVYVNAGTQLSQVDSLRGILSPTLLISFVILGFFPLLTKKGFDLYRNRFRRS